MAEPIAGPRRPRPTKTRRSRVWRSVSDVMQNRSNRGSGKPAIATAPRARAYDWDPTPRIALGPAADVRRTAPKASGPPENTTLRGRTAPDQLASTVTKSLANRNHTPRNRPHMASSIANPSIFKSGRSMAAWIGLVPRQNSTGGKERMGRISKQGDQYLRWLLVAGAMTVIRHAKRRGTTDPACQHHQGRGRGAHKNARMGASETWRNLSRPATA